MANQQSPSAYWLKRNRTKAPTTSENVSSTYNKSGIALTGPTGGGTASYKNTPYKKSKVLSKLDPESRITQPGGSGTNVKSQFVGKGDTKRYVEVPEPNKDRGKVSTGSSRSVVTAQQSEGRPTPSESRGGTSKLAANLASKSSDSSAPTAEVGSLNYFMQKTMADGRGNAKNRAYTLYKRYKQAERRNA